MNYKIHHIGKVVHSIQKEYEWYQQFGFKIFDGFATPHDDHEQNVIVGVVEKDGMLIELLEPLNSNSPVFLFQKKGGGFHHICYEVPNLQNGIAEMKKFARQTTPVTTSVWNRRNVVFFIGANNDIIELIE